MWGGYRNGLTKDAVAARHHGQHVLDDERRCRPLRLRVAASRGLIDYDAKVADYWPEFAQAGKAEVTVRQLLSHQAGLSALDAPLRLADLSRPGRRCRRCWRPKPPAWPPGSRHGYHALTLGWYESELIRRTDPAGRTLGRFFADEIAAPLGLDLYIGLPASVNRDRVAHLHGWPRAEALLHLQRDAAPTGAGVAESPRPDRANRSTCPTTSTRCGDYNRDDVRAVEIPAANGIGTAALGRQGLRLRRHRRTRTRFDRRHSRRSDRVSRDADRRDTRQGAARRLDVLAGLLQTGAALHVRIVRQSLRHTGTRRIIRVRRPRYRSRLRLRDEPVGLPPVQRPARARRCARPCSATCWAHGRRSSELFRARWPNRRRR